MMSHEFTQGVIQGLTTTLVSAGIVWIWNHIRNLRIERTLRKLLARVGPSIQENTFGVAIKNESPYPITVRDVTLLTDRPDHGVGLLFTGQNIEYLFQEKPFKDPRQINITKYYPAHKAPPPRDGLVDLPPWTGGSWGTNITAFLEKPDLKPRTCHMSVLYKNLFGISKLLVVDSNEGNAKLLRDQFEKRAQQLAKK